MNAVLVSTAEYVMISDHQGVHTPTGSLQLSHNIKRLDVPNLKPEMTNLLKHQSVLGHSVVGTL